MTESKNPPPPPGEPVRWRSSPLLPIVPCDKGKSIKCTGLEREKETQGNKQRDQRDQRNERQTAPGPNTFNPALAPSARAPPVLRGFLIPIINTIFIGLGTAAYLRKLFLSLSYPKTQPLAPQKQEQPIDNGTKDRLLEKCIPRSFAAQLILGKLLEC